MINRGGTSNGLFLGGAVWVVGLFLNLTLALNLHGVLVNLGVLDFIEPSWNESLHGHVVKCPGFAPDGVICYGDPHAAYLVVGDSHAPPIYLGFTAYGRQAFSISAPGCPVGVHPVWLSRRGYSSCSQANRYIFNLIESSPRRNAIVHSIRFPYYIAGPVGEEFQVKQVGGVGSPIEFVDSFDWGLSNLSLAAERLLVVETVPELGFDPRKCRATRIVQLFGWFEPRENCGIQAHQVEMRSALYLPPLNSVISTLGQSNVSVVRTHDIFCGANTCEAYSGDAQLYFDDDHLSLEGAKLVVGRLMPFLGG